MKMKMHSAFPATLMVLAVSSCSGAVTAALIPDEIGVPLGQALLLQVHATGSQVYECAQGKAGLEWSFRNPEAILTDDNGRRLGKHYAGPTWEVNDGSKVVGEVLASAPARDGESIPQLLLKAKSHTGPGELSRVSTIQRVDTHGGRPPSPACGSGQLGQQVKVPYSAVYNFYFYGSDAY